MWPPGRYGSGDAVANYLLAAVTAPYSPSVVSPCQTQFAAQRPVALAWTADLWPKANRPRCCRRHSGFSLVSAPLLCPVLGPSPTLWSIRLARMREHTDMDMRSPRSALPVGAATEAHRAGLLDSREMPWQCPLALAFSKIRTPAVRSGEPLGGRPMASLGAPCHLNPPQAK